MDRIQATEISKLAINYTNTLSITHKAKFSETYIKVQYKNYRKFDSSGTKILNNCLNMTIGKFQTQRTEDYIEVENICLSISIILQITN